MARSKTQQLSRSELVPTGEIELTRYVVGIDLGTTNTALAYVDRRSGRKARDVRPFDVVQLTDAGITQPERTLPSAVYVRGGHELSDAQITLPWSEKGGQPPVVGVLARKRGAKTPDRLITSAKSWLCHPGVDRQASILPWGSPEEVDKLSPVEVQTRILEHLRAAWDHTIADDDPSKRLENQDLVVTIPASFDEVARELTVEAIKATGLNALLIEEPQAALYAWIAERGEGWKDELEVGDTILVCDVGGGTTDFSLIQVVEEEDGELAFERTAVGDHLLLGGDNMDLALARRVESGLKQQLDLQAWSGLVQSCRDAKERLLEGDTEEIQVAITKRGRKLVGGTIRATVKKAEATESILEGFFPEVAADAAWDEPHAPGLKEFGLPYEKDPAITRHLRGFLRSHGTAKADDAGARLAKIDHVLFNGGVFRTAALRERVLDTIAGWQARPHELTGSNLDLAVSVGAAYYGLVRRGKGTRIKSGAGRAYYVEVASETGDRTALCLIPRGLPEGEVVTTTEPLELHANRPVVFPFHTSTVRDDPPGAVVPLVRGQFQELAPLNTVIRIGKRGGKARVVPVELVARYTELGTLEMYCQEREGERRWRLELDTRARREADSADDDPSAQPNEDLPTGGAAIAPEKVEAAAQLLRETFSLPAAEAQRPLESLGKGLEEHLDGAREGWPVPVIRALFDVLLELKKTRKRSAFHEARWLNLAGFLLRPGFGSALDPFRTAELWKIQLGGMQHPKANAVRIEWVVAFRRVAGGLNQGQQENLFAPIHPQLLGRKKSKTSKQELAEYWRLAASLEYAPVKKKRQLGTHLLELIETGKAPPRWGPWALGRLGGRVPLYGPLDRLVSSDVAELWLESMLKQKLKGGEATFAFVQLARLTGDRARDVSPETRAQVLKHLKTLKVDKRTLRPLEEIVESEVRNEQEFYGDSLPIGLVLRG